MFTLFTTIFASPHPLTPVRACTSGTEYLPAEHAHPLPTVPLNSHPLPADEGEISGIGTDVWAGRPAPPRWRRGRPPSRRRGNVGLAGLAGLGLGRRGGSPRGRRRRRLLHHNHLRNRLDMRKERSRALSLSLPQSFWCPPWPPNDGRKRKSVFKVPRFDLLTGSQKERWIL